MVISCPTCGKVSDLTIATACPRCGCDLKPLTTVVRAAIWQMRAAATHLRRRDWSGALEHAEQSWELRRSTRAARIACLAAMALEENEAAGVWFRRAKSHEAEEGLKV